MGSYFIFFNILYFFKKMLQKVMWEDFFLPLVRDGMAMRAGTVISIINGNVWEQETTDAQKCQRLINSFEKKA